MTESIGPAYAVEMALRSRSELPGYVPGTEYWFILAVVNHFTLTLTTLEKGPYFLVFPFFLNALTL